MKFIEWEFRKSISQLSKVPPRFSTIFFASSNSIRPRPVHMNIYFRIIDSRATRQIAPECPPADRRQV